MSTGSTSQPDRLSAPRILAALRALSEGLAQAEIQGELCLFDGTVMVLAYRARVSTKDVEALFQPTQPIRELARAYSFRCPGWTAAESRWLHRPWFASPLASLRAVLILESPPAFRARNLFVSENALTRV